MMGMNYGPWVEYHCFNDCQQMGCPGHRIREAFSRTSDTLNFEVENGETEYFDVNKWMAMQRAEEAASIARRQEGRTEST